MLKEYRIKKNMSLDKLQELTGLDRKTIYRIENDLNTPLIDTFAKIAVALNLSDSEIVSEIKNSIEKQDKKDK